MDQAVVKNIALLIFFGAVFFLVKTLLTITGTGKTWGGFSASEKTQASIPGLVNIFRPLIVMLLPLTRLLPAPNYRQKITRSLCSAGLDNDFDDNEFLAFQLVCSGLFAFFGIFLFHSLFWTILLALPGLFYPCLWLYEKKTERQRNLIANMPGIVDMLSLSIEAGLDFVGGIQKVCELDENDRKNPFLAELRTLYNFVKLGRSTEDALRIMAERVDLPEVYSFTSILIQSHKMGVSIAKTLKDQSLRIRQQRFVRAERLGSEASQKMLIPVILLIFPVLFIVILGPIILKFIYGRAW